MDGMSVRTSMVGRNERHDGRNWMEDKRGSLMVVATVIATMTFQIAINPPGGVWQAKTDDQQGCEAGKICQAGTSVLVFGSSNQWLKYEIFILLCTVSFSASLTTIILLLCGVSLHNKFIMWFFTIVLSISVICTAGAFSTTQTVEAKAQYVLYYENLLLKSYVVH
ncbi:unnamed protein product [Sphenostylis stenocarpa]|uniref:PGG domain-containing protein n=1 Tax=Sphenostylis stenocarpa TaxID=92480 RepID=A0AA86SI44_9FABA|nr:unnamed protein product [Sphenostylis stenocarpa]